MLDLKIKTSCDRYSKSRNKKVFTFCQNNQCCSTGPIPAQNQNCQENSYQGVEIGDCSEFRFATDNVVGKVIIEKSHSEVSLLEQDTIENVS